MKTKSTQPVKVNYGNVLESKLKEWKGGSRHPHGIAEYITNCDDSYRRQDKYKGQHIWVEIHTRSANRIIELKVLDHAEGMSFDDLENKFFQYFESYSGRRQGAKVRGQFGTGGKAYAIMNFRECWIESVKNGFKSKARFYWDYKTKQILKEYNKGGYIDESVNERTGTTITLLQAIKVNTNPERFVEYLEKLPGLRHVLRGQKVHFKVVRKGKIVKTTDLSYYGPDKSKINKVYNFKLPSNLENAESSNELIINYFEEPLNSDSFIDISDGISSVEDLEVSKIDGRPFAKYLNGNITIEKLLNSSANRENRRGLEDGDDLTEEIYAFLKESATTVINEVESDQKQKDKQKRLEEANKKLNQLSKFLSKRNLDFKLKLNELKKRFSIEELEEGPDPKLDESPKPEYRKPNENDHEDDLVPGRWTITHSGSETDNYEPRLDQFIPERDGPDLAVKVGKRKAQRVPEKIRRRGIKVLFSNDHNNPESPQYTQYDEPVTDRDLESVGIIWINSNHPVIAENLNSSDKLKIAVRNENIANYVLLTIAQYYATKELELQPHNESTDFILSFRKNFFELQQSLRLDNDVKFYD